MKLSNQGVKTYSKGLQVKKAGTFVLKVEDLASDSATGTITIIVSSDDQLNLKNIQLLSPLQIRSTYHQLEERHRATR